MADFRAVVSALPCSPTNKGKKNSCGSAVKANRQWTFVAFWLSSYVEPSGCVYKLIGTKKGRSFQFTSFLGSLCVYYILHNYVILQAMPHAIPQTHSAFYPHRNRGASKKKILVKNVYFLALSKTFLPLINENEQGPSGGGLEKNW